MESQRAMIFSLSIYLRSYEGKEEYPTNIPPVLHNNVRLKDLISN